MSTAMRFADKPATDRDRSDAPPSLTPAEGKRILVEWNQTGRDFPLDACVHQLFAAQAAASPDRVAVRRGDETLTFRELDAHSNRLARRLQALGVAPGSLVGILMERSPDMVAALLAILKAGGAYVPIDPLYPAERIASMLESSAAPVLVTQSVLVSRVPAARAAVVALDPGWHLSAPESADPIESSAAPDDLAYVIYTSGSTGRPKGVQIPHRALVNFLMSMREEPGLQSDDVLLAVTTLSFDIAGLEIYLPLVTGACLELVPREVAADARRLMDVLARSGATVLQATPVTWRMLLEAGWPGDSGLKILCGGEAMPRDLAERLLPRCRSLWNLYGPTETTIWSTLQRLDRIEDAPHVPIGRPIANTQVYLLDPQLQPVPVGAPGELYIAGTGIARGYLGRSDLTAERFLPDPFATRSGARMYRTGDAARWLPDGRIEYLERLDHQVKVRGHRIELSEIETALRRHASVAEAVVTLRTDVPGGKALVAYFVSRGDAPAMHALRDALRKTLPEFMVPPYFVALDALPLTPNGKIDRRALPAPDRSIPGTEEGFAPPRDALESRLTALWSEVLSVPRVGIHDSFFDLGGDSLLALRLFLRIEQSFGRQLPLAALIEASTVAELAAAIRNEGWEAPWSPLVPIQAAGTKIPFFCVHGVGGNVLNYRPLARHLGADQPFYALQAQGLDGARAPLTRIEEMAARYAAEVRRVQPQGPYFLGGLSFGGVVAFEMARQLREAGQDVRLVALFDTAPVGYSAVAPAGGRGGSLSRRIGVHLQVLLHGPNRIAYARQRVRRVWRRIVYRSWQATFAVFSRLRRPLPAALQNVQQANYLALRHYRPGRYEGGVVFFFAEGEPDGFTREKQLGWGVLAAGGVTPERVPGDHLTMLDEPHVRGLAERLAAHLS